MNNLMDIWYNTKRLCNWSPKRRREKMRQKKYSSSLMNEWADH